MRARCKDINLAGESSDLKTKELSSAENTIPITTPPRHVNEALIRDVLEITPDIHLIDKLFIVVVKLDYQLLDSSCNLGQPLIVHESSDGSTLGKSSA